MTFIASCVKETDLDVLYMSTIHAIFVIIMIFFPKVNGIFFFAKHFIQAQYLIIFDFQKNQDTLIILILKNWRL
jgi:hypothetical protein